MSQGLPGLHTLTHVLLALKLSIAATCFLLYGIVCSCIAVLGSSSAFYRPHPHKENCHILQAT